MGTRPARKKAPTSKSTARLASRKGKSNSRPSAGKYEKIRNDLERQRAELLGEAAAFTNHPDQEVYPDLTDQASAEVDQSFVIRLREREQKLIKKIDEALSRIATDTYGICERCGEEIPYQRLKARPVTTLCIECKTLQEEEERVRR